MRLLAPEAGFQNFIVCCIRAAATFAVLQQLPPSPPPNWRLERDMTTPTHGRGTIRFVVISALDVLYTPHSL